jgi:hypothetical protein
MLVKLLPPRWQNLNIYDLEMMDRRRQTAGNLYFAAIFRSSQFVRRTLAMIRACFYPLSGEPIAGIGHNSVLLVVEIGYRLESSWH